MSKIKQLQLKNMLACDVQSNDQLIDICTKVVIVSRCNDAPKHYTKPTVSSMIRVIRAIDKTINRSQS